MQAVRCRSPAARSPTHWAGLRGGLRERPTIEGDTVDDRGQRQRQPCAGVWIARHARKARRRRDRACTRCASPGRTWRGWNGIEDGAGTADHGRRRTRPGASVATFTAPSALNRRSTSSTSTSSGNVVTSTGRRDRAVVDVQPHATPRPRMLATRRVVAEGGDGRLGAIAYISTRPRRQGRTGCC